MLTYGVLFPAYDNECWPDIDMKKSSPVFVGVERLRNFSKGYAVLFTTARSCGGKVFVYGKFPVDLNNDTAISCGGVAWGWEYVPPHYQLEREQVDTDNFHYYCIEVEIP